VLYAPEWPVTNPETQAVAPRLFPASLPALDVPVTMKTSYPRPGRVRARWRYIFRERSTAEQGSSWYAPSEQNVKHTAVSTA